MKHLIIKFICRSLLKLNTRSNIKLGQINIIKYTDSLGKERIKHKRFEEQFYIPSIAVFLIRNSVDEGEIGKFNDFKLTISRQEKMYFNIE